MSKRRDELEAVLEKIADPAGEGVRTCLTVYATAARAAADATDARAASGITLGPLDGVVVTVKDLFDIAGETTRAGSLWREKAAPASVDAPIVRRLRQAGAVIVAKTNMSEFAFTGIGMNQHYGTPANPHDRARAPGGSSSGAAVAVADGIGRIGIGTDTGGSTRIPASFCGIVGFKPTARRVPTQGAFPLSFTLDSIGPMARTVADCALADAIMAGEEPSALPPPGLAGLRLGVVQGFPLRDLDGTVGPAYEAALSALSRAGASLVEVDLDPLFVNMHAVNARGGFAAPEAAAIHHAWLDDQTAPIDAVVRQRVTAGRAVTAPVYVEMLRERAVLIAMMDEAMTPFDALVWPTTPIVAPVIAELDTLERFMPVNGQALRNTNPVNFFDACAISLPMPTAGLPAGLMLVGRHGADRRLLALAEAVEALFARN